MTPCRRAPKLLTFKSGGTGFLFYGDEKMINEFFKQWFDETYSVQKNGAVRDRGNRRVDTTTVWAEWMKLKRFREASGNWAPIEVEDVDEYADDVHDRTWPQSNEVGVTKEEADFQALSDFVELFEKNYEVIAKDEYIYIKDSKFVKPLLEEFPDLQVIGAHFAGWSMWEEATKELAGTPNLIVDLSSSLYALSPKTAKELIPSFLIES